MSESSYQLIAMFVANAGLIAWFRSESRQDWRHMDSRLHAIQEEIKDFHGRLCAIEENKNKSNTHDTTKTHK